MKTTEARGRHLTPDEIVARVFPAGEEPAPVPLHLAVCAECQARVASLREGWLLDRGAVVGMVDALPDAFWEGQTQAVMGAVAAGEMTAAASGVHPFPFSIQRSFLRRPVLAISSLAAALALVAGISYLHPRGGRPAGAVAGNGLPKAAPTVVVPANDRSDDELLRAVDSVLSEETPYVHLVPEGVS